MELYHYGVKGQKWGVRRAVKKANKYLNNVEKYQGKANTALQASKGHKLLSTKAKNRANKSGEQTTVNNEYAKAYERASRELKK